MKRVLKAMLLFAVVAAVVVATGVFAYKSGTTHAAVAAQQTQLNRVGGKEVTRGVVNRVRTVPLALRSISETVTAYGTVVPKASEIRTLSVPIQTKVARVLVSAGQPVAQGEDLIRVAPSPLARLSLAEAHNAATAAGKNLAQVEQRFRLKLTTQRRVLRAQQAAQLAQLRLESLQDQGGGLQKPLMAPTDGVVAMINVQTGQIVNAGSPLLEMVAGHHIEVQLGVEPAYVKQLRPGEKVRLAPVNQTLANSFTGHIRLITRRVNPDTRLVNVFVSVPRKVPLILNGYVQGAVVIARKQTLVVPRKAVLPSGGHWVLYTVVHGHAVRHVVRLGLRNDHGVEVIGQGLKPGLPVVVAGNYELTNGMAVHLEKGR